jgi:OmpA-OmpF porin, OOP family
VLLLASVLAFLSAPTALAQDAFSRGIDLVPFKVTPSINSGLTLDGAEAKPAQTFLLTALADFNFGLLSLKLGNQRLGELIPFRVDLHLMGAYQLHKRIEVSADIPVTLGQIHAFRLLSEQGFPQDPPRVAGLGAPRLMGRFTILRQDEFPLVSLAAIAEVRFPIGDTFSFFSDRGFVFAPRLAVERRFGALRLLFNLGWRFRSAAGQYLNLFVNHEFHMGGGAIIELPEFSKVRQPHLIGELNISTATEAPFTFRDAEALKTPFELVLGARAHIGEHWGFILGFGKGLGASGYGREAFRVFAGLRFEHVPQPDQDGDGIPDVNDACVSLAEDKDGFEDTDGCPEPGPDRDSDGDGVPDKIDGCPDKPGPGPLDGCPDKDGDQIPDVADACPNEPGPAELAGCPPPPNEETVVLESERIRIKNQVLFEFGKAVIDPRSYPLLDEVVKVLRDNPDVGPVLIEGHTDNIGSRPYNIDLSRRRAKAVENYLTQKGIAAKRLRSDGFGFDRPIAPNDSALNRAKNRRTEFRLVDEVELPTKIKK